MEQVVPVLFSFRSSYTVALRRCRMEMKQFSFQGGLDEGKVILTQTNNLIATLTYEFMLGNFETQ